MELILRDVGYGPIYEQIKNELKRNVLGGELQPGTKLPSIRALARDLRVSVITTKRAYEDLETEGFLTAIPGKGYYVTLNSSVWASFESDLKVKQHLREAVRDAKLLKMSREQVEELLDAYWEEKEE